MNNYKDMADFLLGDADDADMLNHTYFEMTPDRARHIALALQDQQKDIDELNQYIGVQAKRIAELEAANRKRKELNAQMLMNAAESGNRNYLVEIEALRAALAERNK